MEKSRPISLQTFIYRTLALRLILMALAIGLATAAVAYVVERQNLRGAVVEETRIEILLLVKRTLQISEQDGDDKQAAFRQALNERLSIELMPKNGEFVYVCFYEADNPGVEERQAPGYALMDDVLRFVRSRPRFVPRTGEWAETVMLGGRLHVHVVMPMHDPSGDKTYYAQAIFAPSEAALAAIRQKLRRNVLMAILIVLATSGLLYPVIHHLVRKLVIFSRNLLETNLETLSLLASTIAKRDSDTDVHNFRVTLYSIRLAEALHRPYAEMQTLIKGSFLHDIGKIGIRDNILLKAGSLGAEEFSLMQEHVRHGMDIINGSVWLRDAALVVGSHHEKFDGSGYPRGISGETIPLPARIFAIADVFDALTSRRPYKEPLSYEAARSLLEKGRGTHFDPILLDAFLGISMELYRAYAGRDDQGIREELKTVITKYFSKGEILLY
jgi:HD-GYP domain-containing protein (c-di-GMP phosphodiesterase class II)